MEKENISQNGSTMKDESPPMTTFMVDGGQPKANPDMKRNKKRTKFGLLKMAVRLFQPAPKTDRKQAKLTIKKQADEITKPAQWEKIVGSMRPLHLQENFQSPTRSVANVAPDSSPRKEDGPLSEDDFICSPVVSSPSASLYSNKSDGFTMSQYNSAVNLQDLDAPKSRYSSYASLQGLDTPRSRYCSMNNLQDLLKGDEGEDEDEDEVFESIAADDMIDSKADEFIAKFYQVMSLERSHRKPSGDMWRL